jgi:hypothetical protein
MQKFLDAMPGEGAPKIKKQNVSEALELQKLSILPITSCWEGSHAHT